MGEAKPFNLFVYGTLTNPSVFRAVLGYRLAPLSSEADGVEAFHARPAVLTGHKKVSPDHTYLYAVPDKQGRIQGYVIGPLPGRCLEALRKYEGRNYARRRLRVLTKDGAVEAVAFVGNLKQMEHSFGYAFHDPFKQEVLLREKIDSALLETEREQLHTDAQVARRAVAELRGPVIRDILRKHFDSGGISDYAIRHSIKDEALRDFSRVRDDPAARALSNNYLALVVRQVIFNEFEERIRTDFRYELDHLPQPTSHYERTISSLAALRMLNRNKKLLEDIVGDCLAKLSVKRDRLVDFVQRAIAASDAAFDARKAGHQLRLIRNHMGQGFIPLGAELEFSNIGHKVIRSPSGRRGRDGKYDGFLYFKDFGLDILTWKLGGHIDDHRKKVSDEPRRGFFELALGNVSLEANLSKPITSDPWVLNQIIHEVRRFYAVRPHSVHISLQLRSRHRPVQDRTLPLSFMKCLFAIAGDPGIGPDGRFHMRRLTGDEIVNTEKTPTMLFSEIRKRYSSESDESYPMLHAHNPAGRYVQQFRFLRLSHELNYEPIVMALKGIQLSLRPGSFLTAEQYKTSRKHRQLFEELMGWGEAPSPIPVEDVDDFLEQVRKGLMTEQRGKPVHSEAYIAWAISRLRKTMEAYNALCERQGRPLADADAPRAATRIEPVGPA